MSVFVEKAGVLDTVQDDGRLRLGHMGINANGVMDWYAHELSNALTGNPLGEAVLEMHFPAPILRFQHAATISITGADFGATINTHPIPRNRTIMVPAGARLLFERKHCGTRVYLSVSGGWSIHTVLGSKSTNLKAGFGGWMGRKLMAGDMIGFESAATDDTDALQIKPGFAVDRSMDNVIRVLPGPEWGHLDPTAQNAVMAASFSALPNSDRMAIRWSAEAVSMESANAMVSSPVLMGTVQLLPNGQVLTLMADHQTVGGYPRVLQVIKADLPLLAQLTPGNGIHFQLVDFEQAHAALAEMKSHLQRIATAVRLQMTFGK